MSRNTICVLCRLLASTPYIPGVLFATIHNSENTEPTAQASRRRPPSFLLQYTTSEQEPASKTFLNGEASHCYALCILRGIKALLGHFNRRVSHLPKKVDTLQCTPIWTKAKNR